VDRDNVLRCRGNGVAAGAGACAFVWAGQAAPIMTSRMTAKDLPALRFNLRDNVLMENLL
jgi:hypothetical protein